jgi:hypothetical protein
MTLRPKRSWIRRALASGAAALAITVGVATLAPQPAEADHKHWKKHGWYGKHGWHGKPWRHRHHGSAFFYYGGPSYYYAPPPRVYYYPPPPVYYYPRYRYHAPPSFSFGLTLPID